MKNIKDIFLTITSNFVSTFVSALVAFVLPRFLGVKEYSYYQLFIFYNAYTPLLYIGWAEGILLRYGGMYYDKIDKKKISGQIIGFEIVEIIVGIILLLLSFNIYDINYRCVSIALSLSVLMNLYMLMQNFYVAVGEIKKYCMGIIFSRLITLFLITIFLFLKVRDFKAYIILEIAGMFVGTVIYIFLCHDFFENGLPSTKNICLEAKENMSAGYKLQFANLSNLLIVGVIRIAIEKQYPIETFGKIAFTISATNFGLKFVSAVATVMFPILKRMKEKEMIDVYENISSSIVILTTSLLLAYYPMQYILSLWLPNYLDAIKFMGILFPICIFECKTSLITNTYLKALRKEKWLLIVNVSMVLVSSLLAYITIYLINSLYLAVVAIVFVLALRSIVSETLLSGIFKINIKKNVLSELGIAIAFILTNNIIRDFSFIVFLLFYFIFLVLNKNEAIALYSAVIRKIYSLKRRK